jgi:hypothetical protein
VSKQAGLGMAYFFGGYDLSGDTQSFAKISGGPALIDVTAISEQAYERLGGERDGGIDWVSFFNATGAHVPLSALPAADLIGTVMVGPLAVGCPAASCNGKQLNYDPTRGNDGSLTLAVSEQSNGFGLEWGVALTAGKRTDTAATNGASVDFGAASPSFGAQAYLQAFAFTGTDATVKLQDSADNTTFADVAGGAFTQITGGVPLAQRIATAGNLQIRRYVRAVTVTSGGFTSLTFAVQISVNPVAVVF